MMFRTQRIMRRRSPAAWRAGAPPAGAARLGMRRTHRLDHPLGGAALGALGRDVHDLLPDRRGAGQILLPEGAHDADVQHGLGVLRLDLQRALELRQRPIGLVGVVVADPEVGRDVDVLRVEPERRFVPGDGFGIALGVEVGVADLGPDRGVARVVGGALAQAVDPRLIDLGRLGRSAALSARARRAPPVDGPAAAADAPAGGGAEAGRACWAPMIHPVRKPNRTPATPSATDSLVIEARPDTPARWRTGRRTTPG